MPLNNLPLVSIIIPFCDRQIETIRAIKSVIIQNYLNYEIILINDGSQNNIKEIVKFIKNFKNIKIFSQTNEGPGSARNFGIREAKGKYIAFLDSDDEWLPNKLKNQIEYMMKKNIAFTHTSYLIENKVKEANRVIHAGKNNYRFPLVVFHNKIATPTVVFEKALIKNSEIQFINKYRRGEDTMLWSYISRKTTLCGLPEVLVKVNQGSETSALNNKNNRLGFYSINETLSKHKLIQIIHKIYIYSRILTRTL